MFIKNGSEYTLVKSLIILKPPRSTQDVTESNQQTVYGYALNKSGEKVFSAYSNEIKIDNSKVTTPTLTNAFGGGGTANLNIVSEGAYAPEGSTSVIKGWELYVKKGAKYTLVKCQ